MHHRYFYETLAWLHPDDPWVQQAVTDWRKRYPDVAPPDANGVRKVLQDFPSADPKARPNMKDKAYKAIDTLQPGQAQWAIKALIDKGDFDQARELAQRLLRVYIDNGPKGNMPFHANHILHLIDQAEKAALITQETP